jgi:hypothetical protein
MSGPIPFDPDPVARFSRAQRGNYTTFLDLPEVAKECVHLLRLEGVTICRASGTNTRGLYWFRRVGDAPRREGKYVVAAYLQELFARKVVLPLARPASLHSTWVGISALVALLQSGRPPAEEWIKEILVAGEDCLPRSSVLDRYRAAYPGTDIVRGRELSAALKAVFGIHGDAQQWNQDRTVKTRVIRGVKWAAVEIAEEPEQPEQAYV